jgi:hypothetical protein
MTGRQEYDRTKDRQRILDKYMIDDKIGAGFQMGISTVLCKKGYHFSRPQPG